MSNKTEMTFQQKMVSGFQQVFNKDVILDTLFGDYLFRRNSSLAIDFEFENDALDNGLSYSKMRYEMGKRHPRKIVARKRVPLSILSTDTGWHVCLKKYRTTGLAELGLGVANYFKMLKYLMFLFILAVLISIPTYVLFRAGSYNSHEASPNSINYVLSYLSLGNLG